MRLVTFMYHRHLTSMGLGMSDYVSLHSPLTD